MPPITALKHGRPGAKEDGWVEIQGGLQLWGRPRRPGYQVFVDEKTLFTKFPLRWIHLREILLARSRE